MSESPLSFQSFRVWQVVVPARMDILSAPSKHSPVYSASLSWPEMPIHLVEATTSAGFTAVGECGRGTSRAVVEATLHELLGCNLLAATPVTLWRHDYESNGLPAAYPLRSWEVAEGKSYALMESLWLDAVGKAVGMPAHQLLGGAVRDKVAVDFWANRPAPSTLIALIHEAAELGLTGMKMKCNHFGDTVHALQEIAADIPAGFRFTIDPMYAWRSFREAAQLFDILASLPHAVQIEDPFPFQAVDEWHKARQYKSLTIACHTRTEDVLRVALRENYADTFNLAGGSSYNFLHTSHIAEFAFKDCWHGSALELGVLQHVRLHAAACARNCVLPSDLQSEWVRDATLVTPHMAYEQNMALVPTRPGLGIDLDHAAMQPYIQEEFVIEN